MNRTLAITTLTFLFFLLAVFAVYFLVPKRAQWVVLLIASLGFYLSFGWKSIFFILTTAASVYGATRWMQHLADRRKAYIKEHKQSLSKEEKKTYKAAVQKRRKRILLGALLLNLGMLCVFKYCHFAVAQFNGIAGWFGSGGVNNSFSLIVPLGISFYTFQSVSYLVDVYWEKVEPETNFCKALLFVSFFPQITQGPISRFEQLAPQLCGEHGFSYEAFSRGVQRLIWGFMKKMLIADILSPYVQNVFSEYRHYAGISVLIGAFLYSVQIYADFSGYMDIMCGFCETLGIELTENFERPYFSKSVAEYWRRWHISLGAFFKDYVYYPIGVSGWNRRLAQTCKKKFSKRIGDSIAATVALVVVWGATGLWHGASWAYIVWGLVNGLFLILSLWLEPTYARVKSALHIRESSRVWQGFQTIRTFVLITFIKVLPEVGTLSDGLGLWKQIFTSHAIPHSISELLPFVRWDFSYSPMNVAVAAAGTALLFVCSLLQRKRPLRDRFNRLPMPVRAAVLAVLTFVITALGVMASWGVEGFMYAQF